MDKHMKLHYKIGEIEFEAEGTPEDVEFQRKVFIEGVLPSAVEAMVRTHRPVQVISGINETEQNTLMSSESPALIEATSSDSSSDFSRKSLASYIKEFGEISENMFALAAAYFCERKTGAKSFSIVNVRQWYAEARRVEPQNISVCLNQLAKQGYIMDDPDMAGKLPKCYIISENGLEYIKNYQPKASTSSDRKLSAKNKKTRSKTESQYSQMNIDDLHLDLYPSISKQKEAKNKVTLLMYIISKENQGEWFTKHDLKYLLVNRLGESLSDDQIAGVFRHHPRWFHGEKIENGTEIRYKLQNEGKANVEAIISKTSVE